MRETSAAARTAAIAVAVGLHYGYFGAAMAGAQLFLTPALGLSVGEQGSLFAVPVIGMLVGVLLANRLVTTAGRRATLLAAALVAAVLGALSPLVAHLLWLDATRLLIGLAMGVTTVVVPVYIAEAAPTAVRGRIAVLYQVATVGGIVAAFLVAYALAGAGLWRVMIGLSAPLSAVAAALLLRAPETDRGRAARAEARRAGTGRAGGAVAELLGPRYRTLTRFVLVLGALIQLTGVSAVSNFSPRIFEGMGYRGTFALLVLPAVVQTAGVLAALASSATVERLGRRATLLTGTAVMAVGHALLVLAFLTDRGSGVLGLAGLLVFTVGFNAGLGSLLWIYASEGYTDRLRSAGATALLLPNLAANFLLAQFFLGALTAFGGAATFALLLGVTVAAWLFLHRQAPETRGRTLDEIHAYWQGGRRWPADAAVPVARAGQGSAR
ncbi:MFS transporter [Micromonospora krabiensis]|uniref:Na+/melibiose symporter n=1 Tax=Micromonospora krabiensis TaxID=307121 RepID=A0A1C3MY87_9ACTN|nr:MFS transporter [Micromonospora krabiensis]SBV25296.1 Na+/melibiose symporter [Micromonospora krabiensis]